MPRPIRSFTEAGFGDTLLKEIVKRGFEAPTAIQVGGGRIRCKGSAVLDGSLKGDGRVLKD